MARILLLFTGVPMSMRNRILLVVVLTLCPVLGSEARATEITTQEMRISYLYQLSDFTGTIPYNDAFLHADRARDEIYVISGNIVRIFNRAGMEVYQFDHEREAGTVFGLAVDELGDLLLLTRDLTGNREMADWSITRADYRGIPLGTIPVSGVPPELSEIAPNLMFYQDRQLSLVDTSKLQVLTVDRSGRFQKGHDLASLLQLDDPASVEIFGFAIDQVGNMVFTIPVLFKVFVVSPDETVRSFGTPGSSGGKFGIVSGVAVDDHGNYFVSDKLRNVVMIFGPDFRYITEFGTEMGIRNLLRPTSLLLGNSGRIYVTQVRNKGVSVFATETMALGGLNNEKVIPGTEFPSSSGSASLN